MHLFSILVMIRFLEYLSYALRTYGYAVWSTLNRNQDTVACNRLILVSEYSYVVQAVMDDMVRNQDTAALMFHVNIVSAYDGIGWLTF